MNFQDLSVLIVSNEPEKTDELLAGLAEASTEVLSFQNISELAAQCEVCQNHDLVLLSLSDEEQDDVSRLMPLVKSNCPVILFIDKVGKITLSEMIDAGISSVIVDGLRANRIAPIVETSLSRAKKISSLQIQLDEALLELEERKVIDRAKGLLMAQKNLTEPESYKLLRTTAMNRNCKIIDIAKTIIIVDEM